MPSRSDKQTQPTLIRAYTDGACEGNPGPGGFGVVYAPLDGGPLVELYGAHGDTTNNQMELMAAIALLESLPEASTVELHTDSRYVQDGITQWLPNWKRRNWRLKSGGAVKNAGLWRRLDAAARRHRYIDWRWVKGHAGQDGNERADELASRAIGKLRRGEIEAVSLEEDAEPGEGVAVSGGATAAPAKKKKKAAAATSKRATSTKKSGDLFADVSGDRPRRLILASTSPYRRDLLARLRLPFETASPGVDEAPAKATGKDPADIVRTLARMKAEALAKAYPDALLIGGDQDVVLRGKLLGKPGTKARAAAQLLDLAGHTHQLLTAVAIYDTATGKLHEHLDTHEMTMRPLTRAQARAYIDRDQSEDCAGAYKIESQGIALFSRIQGEDATAIMGLPLLWLTATLANLGLDPLNP